MKQFVAYYRVSTKRQGQSGLGLEAQRNAVSNYVSTAGETVAEYTEVESGKKADRPQLLAAIAACKKTGATLCVAKLDRLARNVYFVSSLQHAGVDFVCVDNQFATPFVVNILACVAQMEAEAISDRTKQALAAAKRRGVVLGNPSPNLDKMHEGATSAKERFAAKIMPAIKQVQSLGITTQQGIADALNRLGHTSRTGKQFRPSNVRNLLALA